MRRRRRLPAPNASFQAKKARILQQLQQPEGEYTDASPKGSVDEGIRPLIDDINRAEGFVTTSSCAGRVSVFLEGRRAADATPADATPADVTPADARREQTAGVGGKGAGGTWLFVSHEPVPSQGSQSHDDGRGSWVDALGFSVPAASTGDEPSWRDEGQGRRLIHFKFEPMILHVLAASPAHAQLLLRAGLQAGFRESGAVNLAAAGDDEQQAAAPLVAIRSLGLGLASLVGCQAGDDGPRRRLVSAEYLEALRALADERFAENVRRVARFRAAFLDAVRDEADEPSPRAAAGPGAAWEDAATRRERMRAEGLRKKAALAAEARRGSLDMDSLDMADLDHSCGENEAGGDGWT